MNTLLNFVLKKKWKQKFFAVNILPPKKRKKDDEQKEEK